MITTDIIAPGQVELTVSGKIEKSDIEASIAFLEGEQQNHAKLNVLADLRDFSGMTMEAFIADLRYGLKNLGSLDKYDRLAVLTDADWIEAMIWIEDKFFRRVDIRCFEPDDRDDALKFIAGEEVAQKPKKPGVIRVPTDREDVIAFRITDTIRDMDAKALSGILLDAYSRHEKIDVLLEIEDFDGFEPGILLGGDYWKMKGQSLSRIGKYALVGAPAYLGGPAGFIGSFLPIDIRTFKKSERDEAWEWIGAKPLLDV